MKRAVVGLTAATVPLLLAFGVAVVVAGAGVLDSQSAAAACLAGDTIPDAGPTTTLTAEQLGNARIIYAVSQQLGLPARAAVIGIATAMQESNLHNLTRATDHDSLGLFQQRPSQGWGSPAQLTDPVYASKAFYAKLVRINGWQTMPVTQAAQAVQRSAYPDAYAKWEALATETVSDVGSGIWRTIPGVLEQCPVNCPGLVSSDGQSSPEPGCLDGMSVLARAATWLTAWGDGPVPYLADADPAAWFHGYRRDCSGYASMALGLPGPGLDTRGLAARSIPITKAVLRAGDLLINTAPGGAGHVVIFDRWADATMNRYVGYEQSGDGGTHHRSIPYPYFGTYQLMPYRV